MARTPHKVRYYIPEYAQSVDDAYEIDTQWDPDTYPWLVAEECADDFDSHHEGWESHWPLDIVLVDGEREVGTFTVDREFEPSFYAYRKAVPGVAADAKST